LFSGLCQSLPIGDDVIVLNLHSDEPPAIAAVEAIRGGAGELVEWLRGQGGISAEELH